MQVSYDTEAGATYVRIAHGTVARTVSVSDLTMVDLDENDQPLGVEFVVPPRAITEQMVLRVTDRFPALDYLLKMDTWLSQHA